MLQQTEELSVLLMGYLGNCDSSREGLHFTCGVKLLAALLGYLAPECTVMRTSTPLKTQKGQGFAPSASPGNPRWESSTDGKLQNWDAQRKPLRSTFTVSYGARWSSALFLWGCFCSFLSPLCASSSGESFGEDRGPVEGQGSSETSEREPSCSPLNW